jgi:hypothetical protein
MTTQKDMFKLIDSSDGSGKPQVRRRNYADEGPGYTPILRLQPDQETSLLVKTNCSPDRAVFQHTAQSSGGGGERLASSGGAGRDLTYVNCRRTRRAVFS